MRSRLSMVALVTFLLAAIAVPAAQAAKIEDVQGPFTDRFRPAFVWTLCAVPFQVFSEIKQAFLMLFLRAHPAAIQSADILYQSFGSIISPASSSSSSAKTFESRVFPSNTCSAMNSRRSIA